MSDIELLTAKVWHKRETPKVNEFTYRVFYVSYDMNNESLVKPAFFSFDRWNLMSIFQSDHGPRNGATIRDWVVGVFEDEGVVMSETDTLEMISHPRVLGYAFNPISFFLILSHRGEIKAALCEVHNTFGDDHNYLLIPENEEGIQPTDVFTAPKHLYVSPFNDMSGGYTFSLERTPEKFTADIVYLQENEPVVRTAVGGTYRSLTGTGVLWTFLTHPLMTIMVITRIHLQAIRLWLKGVPHQMAAKPENTAGGVTKATLQT